jgi:hypothetical protein
VEHLERLEETTHDEELVRLAEQCLEAPVKVLVYLNPIEVRGQSSDRIDMDASGDGVRDRRITEITGKRHCSDYREAGVPSEEGACNPAWCVTERKIKQVERWRKWENARGASLIYGFVDRAGSQYQDILLERSPRVGDPIPTPHGGIDPMPDSIEDDLFAVDRIPIEEGEFQGDSQEGGPSAIQVQASLDQVVEGLGWEVDRRTKGRREGRIIVGFLAYQR